MKKILLIAGIIILFAVASSFLADKYFSADINFATVLSSVVGLQTSTQKIKTVPIIKDWGTVSSNLGFSVQYPYKQIGVMLGNSGVFSVDFLLHPSMVFSDASSTEEVEGMMTNNILFGSFSIAAIQDNSKGEDLKIWAKAFLSKSEIDAADDNKTKTLSEKITSAVIGGIKGNQLTDTVEELQGKTKLDYVKNNIFARKSGYIYYASYLSPASNTPALLGTYLKQVASTSVTVLNTFTFDKSTTTAITVPNPVQSPLSGAAATRRENLLTALRTGPFFDMSATYPASQDYGCDASSTSVVTNATTTDVFTGELYLSVDSDDATMDMYDTEGDHTGFLPAIPGFSDQGQSQQGIPDVQLSTFGSVNLFDIENVFDGKIVITGKKYGMADLRIASDGNSCAILDTYIPTTPYSIATIPMSTTGDIGPISYDIDGDGKFSNRFDSSAFARKAKTN
jgi:hypothetical protein